MRTFRLLFMVAAGMFLCTQLPAADSAVDPGALTREVHALLKRSCAECHDPATTRRIKGDFDQVLDLQLMAKDEFYLVPGFPEDSELFLVMIDTDPDIVMPPPDSEAHQPTEEEIAMLRDWITLLTPDMDLNALLVPPPEATPTPEPEPETKKSVPLRTVFARMHPMLVHFPIALLLVAALIEGLGWFLKKTKAWEAAVDWSIVISALSTPVAAAMGWILANVEGYREETISLHRGLGLATAILSIVIFALWILKKKHPSAVTIWIFRIFLIIAAVLVALSGHTGGELVYGEGYPFN